MDQSLNQPWWIDVIKALVVINLVMAAFAYSTWLERKLLGRMQQRYGPNGRALRTLAAHRGSREAPAQGELLPRERDRRPLHRRSRGRLFHRARRLQRHPLRRRRHVGDYDVTGWIANVSIGLLLIFALGAIGIYAFLVGGWASESKYSLLGSMRTAAQLVSYEVSLALSVLGVVIMGQSLSLVDIAEKQQATIWFAAPQFVGLLVFFVAGIAETNRPRSTSPRPSRSSSPATTPSTAACASASTRRPSTST